MAKKRKPISPLRSPDSFRRTPGQKPPRSTTLIVCEGETEKCYFKKLCGRDFFHLNFHVITANTGSKSAPSNVVGCAKKEAEKGGYDHIFCVFDRDRHTSYQQALNEISKLAKRGLPIKPMVSIPCFELWVLLHFEKTDTPFSCCAEIVQRISECHIKNYKKANDDIVDELFPRLDTAIENGEWLEKQAREDSSTSVHRLLLHMKAESENHSK
ncbi:MAG: RloB family protein [Azoarcus sp.]|jgi:hypothetical protein|nr:RloB family protein [Azoarcus sp.]